MRQSWQLSVLLVMAFILFAGCGGEESGTRSSDPEIATLQADISSMPDYARTRSNFEKFYVQGSAPPDADMKKMLTMGFDPKTPTIEGNTAKIKVGVRQNDASIGEVEWTAEKVDGKWKLKSTPLP